VTQSAVDVIVVPPGILGWDDVVALLDAYRVHYGEPSDKAATRRWLDDVAEANRVRCYLATVGDQASDGPTAVGVAFVVRSPATVRLGEVWALRDLYVAADHRDRGVGRAIVSRVCDDASAAGALRVVLQTESDNERALALYASLGFSGVDGVVHLSRQL
jgi:ribosomal protein S18 acetylase RimI-like enzyme